MELIDPQEGLDKLNTLLYKVNQSVKQNQFSNLNRKKFTYDCTQPKLLVGGQLKQYQIQALKWMIDLARRNLNAILADDMGLGKTIQSIAYLAYLKEQHGITGKYLIIAPKTVTTNWLYQMNKWLPCCNAVILFATQKQREFTEKNIIRPRKFDAIITTYQGVTNSINLLRKISWQIIIVDEAHKIKNDESMLAMNLRRYKAQFKLLLTGTPLSNNLRQLWSLLNYVMPQIFENRQLFDQIENTVNFFRGSEQEKFKHQCAIANKFHRIIDPFILRRTKKQINLGLEKKTQNTLFVSLTKLQLKMYKNLLKFSSVYGPYNDYSMNKAMSMRKICNHPYMYPDIEDQQTNGQHLVENCGKLIVLDKLLKKLINEDHKILLFSQFTSLLNIFEDYCEMRGYLYCRIDGQKTIQERQRQIKRFNTKKKIPLFLLSTRAGGLGINLTAADVVIIYDIDWNPQNDNQAMDRAYRIGQTKPVHVFKLITQNTIEQRMLEVQKYKLIWDELVIQKGGMIRKKKGGDFLSSLDYDSISKIGMGDIFRLQLSHENQTIDEIIKMGEEKDQKKYEQAKKKIMDQLQNSMLGEKFANPFEGINEEKQCKQFLQFKSDYQQGKKLTRIEQKNLRQEKNRAESQKIQNKIKKLKIKSSFQLPFYHLYVDEEQLRQMMYDLKLKQSENEQPEIIKILQQKIQALNSKAFTNWTKQQFHKFIQSAKIHQIHNFQAIAKQIGTKTIHQVEQYMNAFFQREMKDSKVKKIVAELNSAQIKLKKNIQHIQMMAYFKKDNLIPLRLNSSRNRSHIIANFYSLRVIINNQLISEESLSRYMEKDLIAIELNKLFGKSFYESQLIKIRKNTVAQFRQKAALGAKMILKQKLNKLKKIYLKQNKKNKPQLKIIQAKLDNDSTPSNISDVTLINIKVHAKQKTKKTRKKAEKTKSIKNDGNEIKVSEMKQKEEQKCELEIKQLKQNDK